MGRVLYSEVNRGKGPRMAAKNHIALYYASVSLGKFLSYSYGKRDSKKSGPVKNVWEMVGVRPSEGMGLSDQMLTNGNYFTCYACADTYALLSVEREDVPEAWGTLEERRRAYADLLNKAKGNFSLAKYRKAEGAPQKAEGAPQKADDDPQKAEGDPQEAEGASPKKRDQSGRFKYDKLDLERIDEKFSNEWIFPRLSKDAVKELSEAVDRGAEAEQGSVDAALGRIAERILDEAKFYEDLYENRVPLVEENWNEESDERIKLDCFWTLLPIWVYTQCLHAIDYVDGLPLNLPLNLYNIGFWEKESAVQELINRLCNRFLDDGQLSGRDLVNKFKEEALKLAEACAKDTQTIEDDFMRGRQTETSTVRELFEKSLKGKLRLPDWAKWRGALIWLIIVSCCVSIERALEGVKSMIPFDPAKERADLKDIAKERRTSACLEGDDSLLDANELGRGSGGLPLHVSEGNRDLPSTSLRLATDALEDEILCVLGHAYESRFWEVVWLKSTHGLLEDFFMSEIHLGSREEVEAGDPRGLLARLWETAESFGRRSVGRTSPLRGLSRVEAVASGRLDVVGELRSALASRLFDCLERSFSRDEGAGHGPELVLGPSRGSGGEGTLIGAVCAAVDDVCELISDAWKIQMERELAEERERIAQMDVSAEERRELEKAAESRSKRRSPNVRSAMLERLLRDARGYFGEQGVLGWGSERVGGEPSQLETLFRQLEQVYEEKYGSDPSMRFALARVRRELSGRLKKAIRLDDVWDVVKKVFAGVAEAEKEAFLQLSLPDVSARHAVLYLESGRLMVADAGSLNGTVVIRRPSDGTTVSDEPRRFVLRGAERTKIERVVEATDVLGGVPETVDALPLCRGDVIRLAGRTAIGVGNRL